MYLICQSSEYASGFLSSSSCVIKREFSPSGTSLTGSPPIIRGVSWFHRDYHWVSHCTPLSTSLTVYYPSVRIHWGNNDWFSRRPQKMSPITSLNPKESNTARMVGSGSAGMWFIAHVVWLEILREHIWYYRYCRVAYLPSSGYNSQAVDEQQGQVLDFCTLLRHLSRCSFCSARYQDDVSFPRVGIRSGV